MASVDSIYKYLQQLPDKRTSTAFTRIFERYFPRASEGTAAANGGAFLDISAVTATAAEINRVAVSANRVVDCTTATLTVTQALHDRKIITLSRAGGIAVTLPVCAAGLSFEFIINTTFTAAASIKSVSGADIMVGHALMGNDSDNSVVSWEALSSNTYDTIDMFGTAHSTGGYEGQRIRVTGIATNKWYVEIIGDAAGTEASPFADTVA